MLKNGLNLLKCILLHERFRYIMRNNNILFIVSQNALVYGADGVSRQIILRYCRYSSAIPIYLLFNLSLKSSTFAVLWKSSFIQPIFKSGNS